MIDWLLLFTGGLLGSAHCVGMCGSFVVSLGVGQPRPIVNFLRQTAYGLGRVFTYAVGGAAAGYAGWRLSGSLPAVVRVQAVLSIAAGVLLLVQGLSSAGVLRLRLWQKADEPCLTPTLFASVMNASRLRSAFLGGVINGLLPCGLVYAYLTLAASAGDVPRGAATMAAFGLGTIPVLVALGCGASFLTCTFRRRLLTVAAWCVVLTGLLAVARGAGFLPPAAAPTCPHCG